MCFELDSVPPIPPISGGAPVRSEDVVLEAADGTRLRRVLRTAGRRRAGRHRRAPRRPRPVPLLRGARAPLRRARLRRGRVRLLRAHRRCRQARRRVPVHGSRRADDARDDRSRTSARRSSTSARPAAAAARPSSPSASATAAATHGSRPRTDTGSRARSASTARPASGTAPRARRSVPPSSRRRSSRSRPATTRTSCPSTTPRSTQALTAAGVEHEIVVYDGAPHSFFDRRQEDYAEQSADAWEPDARVSRRPHAGLRPEVRPRRYRAPARRRCRPGRSEGRARGGGAGAVSAPLRRGATRSAT